MQGGAPLYLHPGRAGLRRFLPPELPQRTGSVVLSRRNLSGAVDSNPIAAKAYRRFRSPRDLFTLRPAVPVRSRPFLRRKAEEIFFSHKNFSQ